MDRTPTVCQTQWYALELPTDIEVSAGERGASFLYNGQVVGGVDYFTCVGIQAAAERGEAVDLAVQTVVDNLFDASALVCDRQRPGGGRGHVPDGGGGGDPHL